MLSWQIAPARKPQITEYPYFDVVLFITLCFKDPDYYGKPDGSHLIHTQNISAYQPFSRITILTQGVLLTEYTDVAKFGFCKPVVQL